MYNNYHTSQMPHQCPCCGLMMEPKHPMMCPCCGMAPQPMPVVPAAKPMSHYQMPEAPQFETCKQVMEPAVSCTQEFHHHHRVDHVVPVVVKNIHCHHNHHHYMIDKKDCEETFCVDHGIRQEDWCALATTQCPMPQKY